MHNQVIEYPPDTEVADNELAFYDSRFHAVSGRTLFNGAVAICSTTTQYPQHFISYDRYRHKRDQIFDRHLHVIDTNQLNKLGNFNRARECKKDVTKERIFSLSYDIGLLPTITFTVRFNLSKGTQSLIVQSSALSSPQRRDYLDADYMLYKGKGILAELLELDPTLAKHAQTLPTAYGFGQYTLALIYKVTQDFLVLFDDKYLLGLDDFGNMHSPLKNGAGRKNINIIAEFLSEWENSRLVDKITGQIDRGLPKITLPQFNLFERKPVSFQDLSPSSPNIERIKLASANQDHGWISHYVAYSSTVPCDGRIGQIILITNTGVKVRTPLVDLGITPQHEAREILANTFWDLRDMDPGFSNRTWRLTEKIEDRINVQRAR